MKSDIPDIFSYLDLVLEELNGLMQSTNSSVRAKAKKVSVCVYVSASVCVFNHIL